MEKILICPNCHGNLEIENSLAFCKECGKNYNKKFDVLDFTQSGEKSEKKFYENRYTDGKEEEFSLDDAKNFWFDKYTPENSLLLDTLKPLQDKKCLLLGNGSSLNELYFLKYGCYLIYTDLAAAGVGRVKNIVDSQLYRFKKSINFYAVNGMKTPFATNQFDIVYGHGFVHHINDKVIFLQEVNRILKPGGKAVFRDGAYSSLWQISKETVLKPLQMYSHWKTGISPEDLRATKEGGFRKEQVTGWFEEANVKIDHQNLIWKKNNFFLHLWNRGVNKLIGAKKLQEIGQSVFKWLDKINEKFEWHQANQLRLVWGFEKVK